ncbi:MAG TPA: hypothetical protein VE152_02950 [Acidimicrobiales bacterium]|nr:hypothetical protein [Acidimicrobiales bacterium]
MAKVVPNPRSSTVLVLTAGMGAGHDGVAQELARRFADRGYQPQVLDILDLLPSVIGRALRRGYALMLRWAPWLYELIFRLWFEPRSGGGPVSPVTLLAERRVARWISIHQPVGAVSTFHLCSTVLGDLRRKGVLAVPSASFVVDLAVHRLWVDQDVDLHVCLHPEAAAEAERRGAPRACAPGPTVRPCFADPSWDRRSARASLGLGADERVVLMVAGSWGTGDIAPTLERIQQAPDLTPLVVCGADEGLRRRLLRQTEATAPPSTDADRRPGGAVPPGTPRIMGWVDDMARLMAAADVLLENAGGLTSLEALAMGVPVVSYHPIPGHGRANVAAMAGADLVAWAHEAADLVPTLELAATASPLRARLVRAGHDLFARDAVDDVLELVSPSPMIRSATPHAEQLGGTSQAQQPRGLRRTAITRNRPGLRARRRSRERRQRLLRVPIWSSRTSVPARPQRLLRRVPTLTGARTWRAAPSKRRSTPGHRSRQRLVPRGPRR